MSKQALLIYGTKFGATKGTAEEIAKTLKEKNFEVKIANAQEEKIKDISNYELIIVGTGLANCKWNGEAENFLKKFQKDLKSKKLAIFVSSLKTLIEKEGRTEEVAKIQKNAFDDKIKKYNLNPISTTFAGAVLDFNKMGLLARKGMEIAFKPLLEKHDYKEVSLGVYDLRDWTEIRNWAVELSKKVD